MDFSKKGLVDGLIKIGNVAIYIVVSMVVVGLGLYVKNQDITIGEAKVAMLVAGANLLLVFLQKWLSTKK